MRNIGIRILLVIPVLCITLSSSATAEPRSMEPGSFQAGDANYEVLFHSDIIMMVDQNPNLDQILLEVQGHPSEFGFLTENDPDDLYDNPMLWYLFEYLSKIR